MSPMTIILVAAAVAAIAWTVTSQVQNVAREKSEKLSAKGAGLLKVRITFALIGAAVAAAALLMLLPFDIRFLTIPISLVVGTIGFFLPLLHQKRKEKARAEAFADQMLEFSMGVSNGLKSGQALPQAIEVYSRNCDEPMKEELAIVLREHRLGIDLAEALERMYTRMPCEDLKLLTVSVSLTMKSGGSLAEVIQKITALIRSRMDFRRKLSALTAQGRFEALAMSLAPVAAFILLFLVERDLMIPLVTTLTGWIAIGVVITLELIGYLVIRKITNIEI